MTRDEITNKVILDAFVDYGLSGVFVPAGKAEGGRIGFAEGDRVTRAGDNEEKAAEDAAALARAIEQENKRKILNFC